MKIKKLLNNINNKIVDKIRKWIGINDDLSRIDNGINMRIQEVLSKTDRRFKDLENKVDINRETLKNVVEISTDVREPNRHSHEHSWATISIGGKVQYVKFVDLNKSNYMEIVRFLKQFEAGRHTIDTPYQSVFEDELFYFKWDKGE